MGGGDRFPESRSPFPGGEDLPDGSTWGGLERFKDEVYEVLVRSTGREASGGSEGVADGVVVSRGESTRGLGESELRESWVGISLSR